MREDRRSISLVDWGFCFVLGIADIARSAIAVIATIVHHVKADDV